jgi:hypothetical protein
VPLFIAGGFVIGLAIDTVVNIIRGDASKRKKKKKSRSD